MTQHHLEIRIIPRPGLLDPEGKAIHHALDSLGYESVRNVRVGKAIYVDLEAPTSEQAIEEAEAMCRGLLANPVTEDFEIGMVSPATDPGKPS
ncbi:MAG: phosphoribosylformylglycinamidine synthase subunit PurS [Gemmatimonadota bacterium]|nr:MAG: phosphoribosylformylglycinamidine synthase subunit PurS [Gemmatimonadota bacterium]